MQISSISDQCNNDKLLSNNSRNLTIPQQSGMTIHYYPPLKVSYNDGTLDRPLGVQSLFLVITA